jgi:hypothetical protein
MGARQYRIIFTDRPTWPASVPARLDGAVPAALPDAAILERLLALNAARAGAR